MRRLSGRLRSALLIGVQGIRARKTRCEIGLDQHLAEFAGGIPARARPPWGA